MRYSEALDTYAKEVGPKFASIVRRYVEAEGDQYDQTFTRYLEGLERAGMARGTVDLHRRTIRAFYKHFNMPVPKARGWEFDSEAESRRPALHSQLVAQFVGAARDGQVTARQVAVLALTSIYGMRAEEVARVQERDIDHEGRRIFCRTAKKGVPRWLWLPPEMEKWLLIEWAPTTANSIEKAFAAIWGQVLEIPRPPHTGWHSLRRGLVFALKESGVPEDDRERFMRWKTASSMVKRYSRPNVLVGADGEAPAREEGDEGSRLYDEAVWSNHPWLPLWR